MNLLVRRTAAEDWEQILEIRRHELVKPQQYRLSPLETPAFYRHVLEQPNTPHVSWTIFEENRVIGHVIGVVRGRGKKKTCSLGWNLHPEYWGRGLMHRSLLEVFEEIFRTDVAMIVADRFQQNTRCGGLLAKLGFVEGHIGRWERLRIWIFECCPHRIIRSELTAAVWWESVAAKGLAK